MQHRLNCLQHLYLPSSKLFLHEKENCTGFTGVYVNYRFRKSICLGQNRT